MKLRTIWNDATAKTQKFDPNNVKSDKESRKFLYDPENVTTEPDCIDINEDLCKKWWSTDGKNTRRADDIAFNERKMLRLAFHDCSPYENGGGGCDGCLNLDQNLPDNENDGLQFSVAVLVSNCNLQIFSPTFQR